MICAENIAIYQDCRIAMCHRPLSHIMSQQTNKGRMGKLGSLEKKICLFLLSLNFCVIVVIRCTGRQNLIGTVVKYGLYYHII